jgi:hypothetical protein
MEDQPEMGLGGTAGDPIAGTAEEPVGGDGQGAGRRGRPVGSGRGAGRRGRSPRAGGGVLRSRPLERNRTSRWTGY